MDLPAKAGSNAPSPSRKHSVGWWLLVFVFILLPIPWGPWWLTIIFLTILFLMGWVLFGRGKRSSKTES